MAFICVVDDEADVLDAVGRVLKFEGYEVMLFDHPARLLEQLEKRAPDLVVLDISMPEMDGITLCRRLRADPRFIALPVVFLTARGTTDDVVIGFEAGADDYIPKPFEVPELRARIAAVLRRSVRDRVANVLQLGELRLDSDTYRVVVDNREIQLTSTEHRLLRYMMEHPDQALSPGHLLQAVWEYPPNTGDADLVRAHMRNLRAKVEQGHTRKYIRTIHGVGYMISG
jgi:DNA-binding response OmpR family regulator